MKMELLLRSGARCFMFAGTSLTLIWIPVALAGHVDDGVRMMKKGRTTEAAAAFVNGCVDGDKKSCNALAVFGRRIGNKEYQMLGAMNACRLGDSNACSFAGGEMVLEGKIDDGVGFLKLGCLLGSKLGCEQLKLLMRGY